MRFTTTLKLNYEFARVYHKGKYAANRYVVVHYMKKRAPGNRLGVSCSRKVKGSVRRNRRKRLLRESYRMLEPQLETGYDIVLIARDWAGDPRCADIADDIARTMRRIGLIKGPAPERRETTEDGRDGTQDPAGADPVL
ncbi:MAG: ribonuclease P protein component [Clostridia bacterium]|nr:ribonuclease P protein component [Clostridia bacterium]